MRKNAQSGNWRLGLIGAAVTIFVSWLLWFPKVGGWLTCLSYDLATVLKPARQPPDLIMVYLDETTFARLGENPQNFDRREHAKVLRHLKADGARLVVYDIWFNDPRSDEENQELASAMIEHGGVVIAIALETSSQGALRGTTERRPLPIFERAAAGLGVSQILDKRSVVRRYLPGIDEAPSLPWAAARVAGLDRAQPPRREPVDTWIHYYGPPGVLRSMHFSDVTGQSSGFFKGKDVFIGSFPRTPDALDEADEFQVPHSRFGAGYSPGVDIWAHAFLNVMRGESLRRWSTAGEWCLLGITGGLLGFGLGLTPFRRGCLAALAMGAIAAPIGIGWTWWRQEWFCWTLIAGAQVPVAIAWAYWVQFKKVTWEKEVLEEQLASAVDSSRQLLGLPPRGRLDDTKQSPIVPRITDHTLIRRVGRGAYGEVWLARNAIGLFHAVKIVYRDDFEGGEPYEREFKGIERFMPVSRSHQALVHVLHVGRDDRQGWFYYVMEAADDLEGGDVIDPELYVPRSLSAILRRQGSLDARTCVAWMLALAEGLDHLHQHHLIHRDIKPANIILVQGRPKLADIGLVTDMASTKEPVSLVGTEGYIAPEGPGSPEADLYGLGKVFYQACTGQDPELFPELPTDFYKRPDRELMTGLNRILGKLCDSEPDHRHQSGAELAQALRRLLDAAGSGI